MKSHRILLLILLIFSILIFSPFKASAQSSPELAGKPLSQSSITVQSNSTTLDFPNQLSFLLQASSSAQIDQVYLSYHTAARSCTPGNVRHRLDFDPANQVELSWDWDFKNSGSLPPGAQVTWYWEIRDANGDTFTTEPQTLVIEDPHHTWKSVTRDQVSIYWADGSQAFGEELLQIALDAIDNLSVSAGIRPSGDVRINVYPSADDLIKAVLFLPEWTGGLAIVEHGILMAGIEDGNTTWAKDVIPHELAHLVTGERVFNCLGVGLPTWLSEGLAVSSEGPISDYDRLLVENALADDSLPPLRTLTAGFPANTDRAVEAYAQSGAVVRFLLEEYGPAKMADLLDAFQSGERIEPALQAVYALSTDLLDQAWRQSLGYELVLPTSMPTTLAESQPTAVPTLALWTPAFGGGQVTETPTIPSPTVEPSPIPQASATALPPTEPAATAVTADEKPAPGRGIPCLGGLGMVGLFGFASLTRPFIRWRKNKNS